MLGDNFSRKRTIFSKGKDSVNVIQDSKEYF